MVRAFADIEQDIRALGRNDQVRLLRRVLEELKALPHAMTLRVLRAEIERDLAAANDYVTRHGSFAEMAGGHCVARGSVFERSIPAAMEVACKDE